MLLMKEKIYKILGIVFIILLIVAVIVTSIIISNKKEGLDKIPDASHTELL